MTGGVATAMSTGVTTTRPDPLRHQDQVLPTTPETSVYKPPPIRNGGVSSTVSSPGGHSSTSGSIRPRSLFTSHTHSTGGHGHEARDPFAQYPEYSKFSRSSPRERDHWISPQLADYDDYDQPLYNYPIPVNRGSGFSPVYFNDDINDPYSLHGDNCSDDGTIMGASVTNQGLMSLRLHSGVQVDITINRGIRVINKRSQIIIAISPDGNSAALLHPSGKVYGYGTRVEITTTDCNGNTKFAKMFYKGVSFTSDTSALTYLVDQAGTRTTSDTFSDMNGDFSIPIFLSDASYGNECIRECTKTLRQSQYWVTEDGVDNWVINGIRVSQTADGLVRVGRGTSKYQIRTSPLNGTVTLTTPNVHSTASLGLPTPNGSGGPHLFVKRGERRLHSDGLTFIVRNAGHASGFDEFNQLKVY